MQKIWSLNIQGVQGCPALASWLKHPLASYCSAMSEVPLDWSITQFRLLSDQGLLLLSTSVNSPVLHQHIYRVDAGLWLREGTCLNAVRVCNSLSFKFVGMLTLFSLPLLLFCKL